MAVRTSEMNSIQFTPGLPACSALITILAAY
ncbi:hypothetical protein J2S19_002207 [Metabacillus malikii]|uniref:Uncharacterized protein n=1 Tax=Metabacillus malikii TaxID=1504265 RepID=A0ABT9ZGL7_9BACI|nr:hypothetical protein [Metabacillus malikii]